ncbi:MAG: hypothetical protein RLN60_02800 [Phycisphaerales bacterium]
MKQKLTEIWILITDDKKKAGILGSLVAVLFLFGIRTFFKGSPDAASASQTLREGGLNSALGGSSITADALRAIDGSNIVEVNAPPRVDRDLFAISEEHFPQPVQTEQPETARGKSGSGSTETDVEGPSEAVPRLEDLIAAQVTALELRSTIVGEKPVAIILSGREQFVVSVGGDVAGFTVVEIRLRSVILEKEGIRVEIVR